MIEVDFVFAYIVAGSDAPNRAFMLPPETPVAERWVYATTIATARDGDEQRSSLRQHPRTEVDYNFVVLNDEERKLMFDVVFNNIKNGFTVPLYAHATNTTDTVAAGNDTIPINPASTDIRSGDMVYYMTPDGETGAVEYAAFVGVDYLLLAFGVAFDLPAGSWVMPARAMLLPDGQGITMRAVGGTVSLGFSGVENERPALRPGQPTGLVASFDGLPLLNRRHLANDAIRDQFAALPEIIADAADVRTKSFATMRTPRVGGSRSYKFDRRTEFDYWREFASLTNGQRSPFLFNSYRRDLEPRENVPGSELIIVGTGYLGKFDDDEYRRIQIEANGAISNHVVTDALEISGDTVLTLDTPFADANISRVSYLHKVRLASDVIYFEHHQLHSIVTINIRGCAE